MKKNLRDYYTTIDIIAQKWQKNDKKMTPDYVARKFGEILTEIGFKEEKAWFMSESVNGGTGRFIFGSDDPLMRLQQIFDIFKENKRMITSEEKEVLQDNLKDILPPFRNTNDYEKTTIAYNNAKIAEKESNNQERSAKDADFLACMREENSSYEHIARIDELVEKYYLDTRTSGFFEERIFVDIPSSGGRSVITGLKERQAFYQYQYTKLDEWKEKWFFIMENARRIRIAERFNNGYEVCLEKYGDSSDKKKRRKVYQNEELKNMELKKLCGERTWIKCCDLCGYLVFKYYENIDEGKNIDERNTAGIARELNKEKCMEECCKLVEVITSHPLKKFFEEDFNFMIKKAFEELEVIGERVSDKLRAIIYCKEVDGGREDDLEELRNIEEWREMENQKPKRLNLAEISKGQYLKENMK